MRTLLLLRHTCQKRSAVLTIHGLLLLLLWMLLLSKIGTRRAEISQIRSRRVVRSESSRVLKIGRGHRLVVQILAAHSLIRAGRRCCSWIEGGRRRLPISIIGHVGSWGGEGASGKRCLIRLRLLLLMLKILVQTRRSRIRVLIAAGDSIA